MQQTVPFRNMIRARIRPETACSGTVRLNPLDHFESWFLLEVVYFYHHTLDPAGLQHSLRLALQDYPLLCGQLRTTPDGSLHIDYPHQGVLFSTCECDLTIEEASQGLHITYSVDNFIEKINPLLFSGNNKPLASFKLIRMKGGGSVLGIAVAHALTDAYSFYYFIQHWSRIHEGLPADTPLHDRSLITLNAQECSGVFTGSAALPDACRGFRQLTSWQLLRLISSFVVRQRSIVCRVLPFNRRQLNAIKNAAQRLGPVSMGDALSAHLWLICTRLTKTAETAAFRKLLIPANLRPQINHPQAAHYFGNAIAHLELVCRQEEIDRCEISAIAQQCRKQIAAFDRAHIKEQMQWLHLQEQRKRMYRIYADIDPYAGDSMISNLSRLPVYGACFGGAQPFWAAVPVIPIPWVLQVMPAPDASGAVAVHAHLPRSVAAMLRSDKWQGELYKFGEAADV
jgi:hypothetical protein